jgi:hypothetical protein
MLLEATDATVYLRENVVPEVRDNNGQKTTMFVYDETQYTKEEYQAAVVAQTRADVDYIAIMQGVEL